MKLDIKINAYFAEFPHDKSEGDNPVLDRVEKSAEKLVQENLRNVIKKLQTQYQSDALGMGSLIYRTNLPLWRQISGQWNEIYQTLPVDVTVKIYLANTAMVRE
jgi:spore germination protein KC